MAKGKRPGGPSLVARRFTCQEILEDDVYAEVQERIENTSLSF
jgi:hypothetical protein